MLGIAELRKVNNKLLHDPVKYGVGSPVLIQSLDGNSIHSCCEVEVNDPKLNQLTAGGVEFDKSSGYSRGLDIPVKLVSMLVSIPKNDGVTESHSQSPTL